MPNSSPDIHERAKPNKLTPAKLVVVMADNGDGLPMTPKDSRQQESSQGIITSTTVSGNNSHPDNQQNDLAIDMAKDPTYKDEQPEKEMEDETGNGNPEFKMDDKPYSVFTHNEKEMIILCAGLCAFFSPISGQIYFPSLDAVAADLHVSSSLVT